MKHLGYNPNFEKLHQDSDLSDFLLGRVIIEHKERYIIQTEEKILSAEITGNLRYSAQSRSDFPAVGDWVKMISMDEENAVIMEVLPRLSILERQAVGKQAETQIIASNIDMAFIVMSPGHDFSINRLERYLTLCNASTSGKTSIIKAAVILTKTDLIDEDETQGLIQEIKNRHKNLDILTVSNLNGDGIEQLSEYMVAFKTYCFLGSSGVGKSSIINNLNGDELMQTSEISISTNKGRHTTSHRELIILPNESIVIDTAGMREIGVVGNEAALEQTFDEIIELAKQCRYSDCQHINEKDCAVLEALENGELDADLYNNYQKLKREQEHFSNTIAEKRQKDKDFGKMIKQVLNEKKKNKF